MINNSNDRNPSVKHILGVGLDNEDGHKRVTKGEGFSILGGSEETHDRMAETVIKTTEDLRVKGKTIKTANPQELVDLMYKNTPSN